MQDPVMAADGHTYERSAIEEWIERAAKGAPRVRCRVVSSMDEPVFVVAAGKVPLSPNTGLPMDTDLKPNHFARRMIGMIKDGSLSHMKPPAVGK
jgi:hypothetical protein